MKVIKVFLSFVAVLSATMGFTYFALFYGGPFLAEHPILIWPMMVLSLAAYGTVLVLPAIL